MLRLEPFSRAHFAALRGWFESEAELVQWAGPFIRPPLDDAKLAAMLEETAREPPARLAWTAMQGAEVVAHAQLVLEPWLGVARLARVAVAPAWRGQGIAVPFLREVVRAAFAKPWLERLELNVRADNVPALRTYAALGFVPEGVRRSAVPVGAERWDIAQQAMLRREFEAGYPAASSALVSSPSRPVSSDMSTPS